MGIGKPRAGKREMTGLKAQYPSEYSAWQNMHKRCYAKQPRNDHFERGIRVCVKWSRFSVFLHDMGPKPPGPSRMWTLERKDNDKGYKPSNCMWATPKQQAQNRRPREPGNSSLVPGLYFAGRTYLQIMQATGLKYRTCVNAVYNWRKQNG